MDNLITSLGEEKKGELFRRGYTLMPFLRDPSQFGVAPLLQRQDWVALDGLMGKLTGPGGPLRDLLSFFAAFSHIEYLISIRGEDPEEEDGIWHDDGSRKMAFSLSLNVNEESIQGGVLEFKGKGEDQILSIKTPPYGTMIIFLTGVSNYEHRIRKVEQGRRIMVIGWCS